MKKLLILALFAVNVACYGQTLKRRTEPPLQEESCRDHLSRLQRDMSAVAKRESVFYLNKQTEDDSKVAWQFYMLSSDIDSDRVKWFAVSPEHCTKSYLSEMEVVLAVMQFAYVQDVNSVDNKEK